MGRILVGTSAWSDLDPFYPKGTTSAGQLPFYARHFPIVEVNTSYYHVPSPAVVEKWVERTPAGFIFDVKPPRQLTRTPETPNAATPEPDADLARLFADAIAPLHDAGKLGAVTFQFPPSYRNTEEHREYLRILPELFPEYRLSVEFRRRDWLDEDHAGDTLALLAEAGLSFTMADEPQAGTGSVPPVYGVTNPALSVVRFHGRNVETWYDFSGTSHGRFNWDYTEDELAEWVPKIERARQEADEVHIFFNTNAGDQGPRNARLLMDQLGIPYASDEVWKALSLFD